MNTADTWPTTYFMSHKTFIKSYTRRNILKAGAASAIAVNFLPSRVFGANERLAVAGIGVGGKGGSDINGAGKIGDVVAPVSYTHLRAHET